MLPWLNIKGGAIVTAAFVLCLLGSVLQVDDTLAPPSAAAYLLAATSSAVTLARNRAPVATLAATTAFGMLVAPLGLLPTPLTMAPAVISAYTLAMRTERRTAVVALFTSSALLVVSTLFFEDDLSLKDTSRLVTVAAAPLVAAMLGRLAKHRQAHLAYVEERALRAEISRDSEARRKVAEERIRIARELHDLVAHQITLANAQANVAARLFTTKPDKARTSLDEVVETTRHALGELRATVGLLRQHDDSSAPREPAPGLAFVPTLLESFRLAGLEVSVHHDGTATPLPPAVDLTAYRVIQEALTNVTKHAKARSADVRLTWDNEWVGIDIIDDGASSHPPLEHSPGYGLIGLRERTTAVGGTLTAGPRPEGGFIVTAQLPLPVTESTARTTGGAPDREDR
ncbi:sensor histidine kinase [Kribbella sp. CA-293567]|uniref:sensor histidine kinase n=1 Tax=Kribbella sp. CA-293567 TaxID=3002436 RepID=UPI0022DE88DE|nr:histidine kinase [Kribbella sp. CA-293567]WBQ03738.1 histidine kinase [Kribbella sp. CA-293567]